VVYSEEEGHVLRRALKIVETAERFIVLICADLNSWTVLRLYRHILTEGEESGCSIRAHLTHGCELGDLITEWDDLANVTKGAALGVTVESNDKDILPARFNRVFHKEVEVVKELSFLNHNEARLFKGREVNNVP
jgi:hypothetical protein